MSVDRVLELKLIGDVSSIDRTLKGTESKIRRMGSAVKSWGVAIAADLAIQGVQVLTDSLMAAWDGFREGEKAAGRLSTTWKNLGLDAGKLDDAIGDIGDRAKELGMDDVEGLDAFNKQLLATGGNARQAARRVELAWDLVGAGVASNMDEAQRIIQGAIKGSSRVVDRFGLTADTAGGRLRQLGDRVEGAAEKAAKLDPFGILMNGLAEDLEGVVGALATGDLDGAVQSFHDMQTDLQKFAAEVGPKITETIDKLTDGGFSKLMGGIDDVIDAIHPLVALFGSVAENSLGLALNAIMGIIDTVIKLMEGDFQGALDTASEAAGRMIENVRDMLSDIVSVMGDWVIDVLNAGWEIGSAIFDGILGGLRNLGRELGDTLGGAVRDAINAVISVWNSLSIPGASFDFPGIDIDVAGFHQNIVPAQRFHLWDQFDPFPFIPALAKGGVVKRASLALLGEAGPEAVVPLDGRHGMGGNTYNITVNVAPGGDLAAAGRQMVKAIAAYEGRAGRSWRAPGPLRSVTAP